MSYTHLSLFSGIGGLDLAAEQAGFETVGQCEFADFPTKVLEKHWPQVARWRDIRDLTGEDFYARTGLRTVDVISGGFPCQPFSVAGKQKGTDDDRYLWPEMLRVIRELAPRCVVGENVPGIIRIAAGQVVKDLEQAGYHVVVFNFEAAAVGAPHRRSRVAFVGYAEHNAVVANSCNKGLQGEQFGGKHKEELGGGKERVSWAASECGENVANALRLGCKWAGYSLEERCNRNTECVAITKNSDAWGDWWSVEPDVGRVAHGVPDWVDRIKCLGNAVVPQQFYPIFLALMQELRREDGL